MGHKRRPSLHCGGRAHQLPYDRDAGIPLKGDRSGQYSIRINRQWRICFDWNVGAAEKVEIVVYHGG